MKKNTANTNIAERRQRILDAAAGLIVRYGYDKTSMSDIAAEAGVTRAIVYLHFDSKDQLFETLLFNETRRYMQAWLEDMQYSPDGGTLAGLFRSALRAVHASAFMAAMMTQDRRMFGSYLRKPGNLFTPVQSRALWPDTIRALQAVHAVREDVDPDLFAHLMNALATGVLTLQNDPGQGEAPPFDALLPLVADLVERTLTPPGGGDQEAGRAVLRSMAEAMRAHFEESAAANTSA
ncbi:MAG: TetR/AcrR family transcriptional regulator [Chloroflexi bacterium]|nr:TetR/AcrR family transcriptional regulator [Chloroflexota bacterium]